MVAEYINVQIHESLRWGVGTMIASTLVATIFALMFALSSPGRPALPVRGEVR